MTKSLPVTRIGAIGAGFMGSGIAEAVAKSGSKSLSTSPNRLRSTARVRIKDSLERPASTGKLCRFRLGDLRVCDSLCEQFKRPEYAHPHY